MKKKKKTISVQILREIFRIFFFIIYIFLIYIPKLILTKLYRLLLNIKKNVLKLIKIIYKKIKLYFFDIPSNLFKKIIKYFIILLSYIIRIVFKNNIKQIEFFTQMSYLDRIPEDLSDFLVLFFSFLIKTEKFKNFIFSIKKFSVNAYYFFDSIYNRSSKIFNFIFSFNVLKTFPIGVVGKVETIHRFISNLESKNNQFVVKKFLSKYETEKVNINYFPFYLSENHRINLPMMYIPLAKTYLFIDLLNKTNMNNIKQNFLQFYNEYYNNIDYYFNFILKEKKLFERRYWYIKNITFILSYFAKKFKLIIHKLINLILKNYKIKKIALERALFFNRCSKIFLGIIFSVYFSDYFYRPYKLFLYIYYSFFGKINKNTDSLIWSINVIKSSKTYFAFIMNLFITYFDFICLTESYKFVFFNKKFSIKANKTIFNKIYKNIRNISNKFLILLDKFDQKLIK